MKEKTFRPLRTRSFMRVIISIVLALTLLSANGIQGSLVYADDAPQSIEDARIALENAESELRTAEQEKAAAEAAYNTANNNYQTKLNDANQKKTARDSAKTAYDTAVADKNAKSQAYDTARQATNVAKDARDAAVEVLAAKNQAAAVAQGAYDTAQANVESQLGRWNQEKAAADEALEAAQAVCDGVGIAFLNQKAGTDLADTVWLNWLQTNMAGKSFGEITWNNLLNTDTFTDAFYSPYSYGNLLEAADLVAEGNALRKSQDSSLQDLKISYKIMTQSIASNALSCHVIGHVLMNDADYKSSQMYTNSGSAGWENISWGATDPFMGWYYEEKIHYLADQNGAYQENVTEAMVEQIVAEATANGHDFYAYTKKYGIGATASAVAASLNNDRPGKNYSTGHYTNLINASHKSTGLSVNAKGTIYRGICHVQNFNQKNMADAVTPEQFKQELQSFASDALAQLEAAQSSVDELKSEPTYYQNAVADRNTKQAALSTALSEKTAAETDKANKEQAWQDAKENETTKQNLYNQASTVCTQAEQTYQTALNDYNNAAGALETALAAKQSAESIKQQKTAAYNTAKANYDKAKENYDKVKENDDEVSGQGQVIPQIDKSKTIKTNTINVVTVTVNVPTVNAGAIDQAIRQAGGSKAYVTKIVLGARVKKISKNTFKVYPKVTVLELRTKKLSKNSIKGSLKGSAVKRAQVKVGNKKTNKKFIKKYKKIFTKKIAGKKVSVK